MFAPEFFGAHSVADINLQLSEDRLESPEILSGGRIDGQRYPRFFIPHRSNEDQQLGDRDPECADAFVYSIHRRIGLSGNVGLVESIGHPDRIGGRMHTGAGGCLKRRHFACDLQYIDRGSHDLLCH